MARPARLREPAPAPEPLLEPADVMLWLGVGRTWVQKHKRELGGYLLDGYLRFERGRVQAYLDSRREPEPAPEAQPEPAPEPEPKPTRLKLLRRGAVHPLDGLPWEQP